MAAFVQGRVQTAQGVGLVIAGGQAHIVRHPAGEWMQRNIQASMLEIKAQGIQQAPGYSLLNRCRHAFWRRGGHGLLFQNLAQ